MVRGEVVKGHKRRMQGGRGVPTSEEVVVDYHSYRNTKDYRWRDGGMYLRTARRHVHLGTVLLLLPVTRQRG